MPLAKSKKKKDPRKKVKGPYFWSLKRADTEFSKYIRERDGKCMRCGKPKSPENPLTCSHFWGRQHKATRFDPDNCVAACWMPCHKYYWEKEKQGAYRDFMLSWLGEEKYEELRRKATTVYPQAKAIQDVMRLLGSL